MQIEVYQVAPDDKEAKKKDSVTPRRNGMWTFKIDGKESLFYSSNEDGIQRKLARLLNGPPAGAVALPSLKQEGRETVSGDGGKGTRGKKGEEASQSAAKGRKERLEAFFSRGKLGEAEHSSKKAKAVQQKE